jgi:hypothetical protein
MIDEIRFTWLTGVTEAIYNVPANQILSFREGSGTVVIEENDGNGGSSTFIERHYVQPNPFVGETNLIFQLAKAETLDLRIFNTLGQEVYHNSKILDEAGTLSFDWDGSGQNSGIYLYTATFGDKQMTGKLVMVTQP